MVSHSDDIQTMGSARRSCVRKSSADVQVLLNSCKSSYAILGIADSENKGQTDNGPNSIGV